MLSNMDAIRWLPPDATSLLDVGCNAGDLLAQFQRQRPGLRLAGVDVNAAQIDAARKRLPGIEFHHASGTALPFPDAAFDCVTCIEVLEHIPARGRVAALKEIQRVLRPGGRLILRVPHAGLFAWLDANNFRFRFPGVYRAVLRRGRRDEGYADGTAEVVWHHHFTKEELIPLLGAGWSVVGECRGGLLLFPLMDIACWPFYRLRRIHNPLFRALQRIAIFDIGLDYGGLSFDMLLAVRKE